MISDSFFYGKKWYDHSFHWKIWHNLYVHVTTGKNGMIIHFIGKKWHNLYVHVHVTIYWKNGMIILFIGRRV